MRKLTLEQFIELSKKVHGELTYDYSLVNFINSKTKVNLLCLICNENFFVTPNNHLNPSNLTGCQKCGHKIGAQKRLSNSSKSSGKLSHEQYIQRIPEINKLNYDISKIRYVNLETPIEVVCKKHNIILFPKAKQLLRKGVCKQCGIDKTKNSSITPFDEFQIRAYKKHNNSYLYDKSSYISLAKHTNIFCTRCCQVFKQRGTNHLAGQGCPFCEHNSFVSKGETEWLDYINIPKHNRNIWIKLICGRRVNVDALVDNIVYEFNGTNIHGDPRIHEADKFSKLHDMTFGEVYKKSCEREELIRQNGYEVVIMWEKDWKSISQTLTIL